MHILALLGYLALVSVCIELFDSLVFVCFGGTMSPGGLLCASPHFLGGVVD